MSKKQYSLNDDTFITPKEREEIKEMHALKEKETKNLLSIEDQAFTPSAVNSYNEKLKEVDPILKNITLPKGKVLIRLFRAPKFLESGLYMPNTKIIMSENTGKPKIEAIDNKEIEYFSRAVVVAVGAEVESTITPGTVVDLYMNCYRNIMQYWSPLDRTNIDLKVPENYFTIPDNQINFVWTTYPM